MTTRVLLVDIHSTRASMLRAALEDAGFSVVGTVASEQDLYTVAAKLTPDAIIVDAASPSRDSLEHLAVLEKRFPKPLLMLSAQDDRKLLAAAAQAGVSSYVVEGISPALVRSLVEVAIQQFQARRSLESELQKARDSLESRKLIDRAKGLLMAQADLSEADAYAHLRKTAMDRGQPMVAVARALLERGAAK